MELFNVSYERNNYDSQHVENNVSSSSYSFNKMISTERKTLNYA